MCDARSGRPLVSVFGWLITLSMIAASFGIYAGAMLIASGLGVSQIGTVAIANVAVFLLAIVIRRRGAHARSAARGRTSVSPKYWLVVLLALVVCWFTGQTTGVWAYLTFGSAGFDATSESLGSTSELLALMTVVFLAPIGEEAMLRGVWYPALRAHISPVFAAIITSLAFAVMHGNIVQMIAVIPLGVLLAFVYEVTQQLTTVIVLHVLFNLLATIVPVGFVVELAHPAVFIPGMLMTAILIITVLPSRYVRKDSPAELVGTA